MSVRRWVLMGVSGCGKTSVGELLAPDLGARYVDGDDLHPQANIDKMSHGIPLTDEDRWPWLDAVGQVLRVPDVIVGCSALKRSYRDAIRAGAGAEVSRRPLRQPGRAGKGRRTERIPIANWAATRRPPKAAPTRVPRCPSDRAGWFESAGVIGSDRSIEAG